MRISGDDLSLRSGFKGENMEPKVPKQAEANMDGVINPPTYNFNHIYRKF